MRRKLFTLMLLVGPLALAGPIYKWVDENGVIHYSDQAHENAQKIQLGAPQTYKATQYPDPVAPASAPPPLSYKCAVISPTDQQAFANVEAVGVSARVDPPPSQDAQIFVMLDGQIVAGQPTSGMQFTLNNVDRGEHNLSILIRDAGGRVACQSTDVTFYVRQSSLMNPQNPLNPANQPPGTQPGQPPPPPPPAPPTPRPR